MPGSQDDVTLEDDTIDDRAEFTDDELADLAMNAEWFDPFGDNVERFGDDDDSKFHLLPEWYMPAPGITRSKARAAVMLGLALSFAVISVGGFCVTWGWPEGVWKG